MNETIFLNVVVGGFIFILINIQDNGNYANSMAADYAHILPNNTDDSHGLFDCFVIKILNHLIPI